MYVNLMMFLLTATDCEQIHPVRTLSLKNLLRNARKINSRKFKNWSHISDNFTALLSTENAVVND